MPSVKNNDVVVRYETAGDKAKQPLVLIFGISMTCEDWSELGYVARLEDDFHVVCVEPRGHGQSTCPVEPRGYALSAMASDIEAAISSLRLERPILWGYSLGAKIALAASDRNPAAYAGLVLGGFELHSNVAPEGDIVAGAFASGPQAWLALWSQMFNVPEGMRKRLARANTRALHALRTAEGDWPSLSATPAKIAAPVLLYAGEDCFFREATARLVDRFSNARYVQRNGRNHFELMLDSEWITNEVIREFKTVA